MSVQDLAAGITYDPQVELEQLGVAVLRQRLRDTWGVWSPRHRVVVASGMTAAQERCVLAHELEHILAGDIGCGIGGVLLRAERVADQRAARKLIALSDFLAVQ